MASPEGYMTPRRLVRLLVVLWRHRLARRPAVLPTGQPVGGCALVPRAAPSGLTHVFANYVSGVGVRQGCSTISRWLRLGGEVLPGQQLGRSRIDRRRRTLGLYAPGRWPRGPRASGKAAWAFLDYGLCSVALCRAAGPPGASSSVC